ncbi:MAG: sodium pump decarboxylase gamma subunit [Ruminococcaceae bacterium]|nr:sodium pump decarboxylase gamma subunit [Oscillospiraceae bacterium]
MWNINLVDLYSSFQIMWQGMLGIFVVMISISFVVYLFTKFSGKKNNQ